MFHFNHILTGRMLSDEEVNEINFIIKWRARRYIAAGEKEWLYPEKKIPTKRWDKLGSGYLLIPDPRSVSNRGDFIIGYKNGTSDVFDEYGRQPGQKGFKDKKRRGKEEVTHSAFKGEFARVFGPKRRETSFEFGRKCLDVDSPEFHSEHLSLERLKPNHSRKRL